ncbi:hypothetical protein OQA88_8691 [Cercophora sp. LCS_1]
MSTTLTLSTPSGLVHRPILANPPRPALPSEIPLINISPIFSSSVTARQSVASQIRQAATTSGFFYITDHGIPPSLLTTAYTSALDFFHLPAEQKDAVHTRHATHHKHKFGWRGFESTRINPYESNDIRESFSWGYDPRHDPSVSTIDAIPKEAMEYLKMEDFPWSNTSPEFKQGVVELWQAVLKLGRAMLRVFALALGLEEHALDEKFTYPDAAVALNWYPTQKAGSGDGDVSIGSHTDFQLFTVLWQDVVGGLQVLNTDGQWLLAKPVEGALVVNFGDYMERITNGKWKSTVHRVVNRSGKERLSMAFFFGFGLHESCGALDTCVEEGEEKKYDEVGCYEWTQMRLRAMHVKTAEEE